MSEKPADAPERQVIVCVNRRGGPGLASCAARGSEAIADALELKLEALGQPGKVVRIRCFGRCTEGPNLRFAPGGAFHRGTCVADVPWLVEEFIAGR